MTNPSANAYGWLLLACLFPLSALRGDVPVMTIAEAKAHLARREFQDPVRIRGVITFSNQRLGLAYVQDASGGIGFDPRTNASPLPKPGDMVEVEGYLSRHQGLTMLLRHRTRLGPPEVQPVFTPAKQSPAPLSFDLDAAAELRIDGLLTTVSGVVRNVSVPVEESEPMIVEISSPSGHAIARLPWREPQAVLDSWLNAPVDLNAVLVSRAASPLLPEDADALLLVSSRADWKLQPQALEEVFQRTPVTAVKAIQATPRSALRERTHVVGTVTAAKARSWVCLRMEDGSIEVSTRQMQDFKPGQRLAVASWPQNKEGRLMLQDGVCRVMGEGTPPLPVKLNKGIFNVNLHRELIQVTGILNTHSLPGGTPRYTLTLPSGVHCRLAWEHFLLPNQIHDLENGSRIRLTGICHFTQDSSSIPESTGLSILPRSLEDIVILAGPSWWTKERLMLTVWWLLGLVGIALPGALVFRWQLWRQSQRIREIECEAATEEERLRIAREFHDCLQQQLSSAALHLDTLKGALHAAPEMLPRLIDDTAAMLRHCQVEARHCIWDLRSDAAVRSSLTTSLNDWLGSRIRPDINTQVQFVHEGTEPPLPEGTPFQLMRIAQEAIANALAHSSARHIQVRLRCTRQHVEMIIEDDGRGFEPGLLTHPRPGHFGLSGLKERAAKIGADLELTTRPGTGTRIAVRLSLSSLQHESSF
ncbi:histidine kinase/DNA gyrase B/HSP90-like ATPase [Prosthecobacter fusiformis]|uniref:Histidine kinase/DNA gyrase B/HSP90-like ATPase n=1 Tax=Prosthecobacter fusiformis TaxID=48464 RepID=A0A4V6Q5N9_9BACT|nr:ATP-binding protein [Prosthecobacter fusiformis]TDU80723.1 histidine kinase/DNA gyrase B/HSP90-like ATPase [Prosthecobacter fusiformis]